MDGPLTAATLFERHRGSLALEWVAGRGGGEHVIEWTGMHARADPDMDVLVGHLNLIHPNRIQVVGISELRYLQGLGKNSHADAIQQLFENGPAFVVIADGEKADEEFIRCADNTATPLFLSTLPEHKLISYLHYYLSNLLAERVTLHGVFMEVMGIGVLLTGESGVGKSELALELITRGQRLVADDAPEFLRIAPDTLKGVCPPALSGFLEVRGLGLLNIRAMFGSSAIKEHRNLRLIIHLERMSDEALRKIDRLQGSTRKYTLLDVEVVQVTLPVASGRNLAVLVEGAVRNHVLSQNGYNAAQDFIERQQRLIPENEM